MIATPRRPLITMDPSKLSLFARAQMVRAGAAGAYGALSGRTGFGELFEPTGTDEEFERVFGTGGDSVVPDADSSIGEGTLFQHRKDPGPGQYQYVREPGVVTSGDITDSNGTSTVDSFFKKLNTIFSPTRAAPVSLAAPSPWPMVLGGLAILVGGVVVLKMMKKA